VELLVVGSRADLVDFVVGSRAGQEARPEVELLVVGSRADLVDLVGSQVDPVEGEGSLRLASSTREVASFLVREASSFLQKVASSSIQGEASSSTQEASCLASRSWAAFRSWAFQSWAYQSWAAFLAYHRKLREERPQDASGGKPPICLVSFDSLPASSPPCRLLL